MEAILTKPRQSYVFDHKLTPEEIQELVDNYDYNPSIYDNDDDLGDGILFDKYGNPTESTIRTMYEEDTHDVGETFYSLDDLFADWDKLWEEANPGEHR